MSKKEAVRYYQIEDQSFWIGPPPGDHIKINEEDRESVQLELDRGAHPVLQDDGSWKVQEADQPPVESALRNLRIERDRQLAASDWTQIPDAPLTAAERRLWQAHRQALRDLPQTFTDGRNVVWPVEPETPSSRRRARERVARAANRRINT